MKLTTDIENKIKMLYKCNKKAMKLDTEIRNYLEEKSLIDNDGNGLNGFEIDSFIDIVEYGTGSEKDLEKLIQHIKQL